MGIAEVLGAGQAVPETGWPEVLSILHMAAFILAFMAGGVLAMTWRSIFPGTSRAAKPGKVPAVPRGNGQVFGHEMKNYLCALRGNASLLRLGAHGAEQASIIDRIERVVEKLEGFAWKDEAAPDVLAPRTRETLDLVRTARNCSELNFSGTGIEFTSQASEGLLLVQGDPHRLDQVFQNLYGNAREAGATRVVTRFRRIGGELEVAIEDNGRGCSQDIADRIFQPFFSTKKGKQSSGLGLFIVQSIVENHRGRIRATTKNGREDGDQGLVVYLHFPLFSPVFPSQNKPAPSNLRLDSMSLVREA